MAYILKRAKPCWYVKRYWMDRRDETLSIMEAPKSRDIIAKCFPHSQFYVWNAYELMPGWAASYVTDISLALGDEDNQETISTCFLLDGNFSSYIIRSHATS